MHLVALYNVYIVMKSRGHIGFLMISGGRTGTSQRSTDLESCARAPVYVFLHHLLFMISVCTRFVVSTQWPLR